jgi:hypothetical protein
MTFSKYLVILGMLLAGWSMAGATGSGASDATSDPSSTSEDSLTGTHTTTHHRKHYGSHGDESTAKKKPGSAAEGGSAAKPSSAGTGETSSAKSEGKKKSASSLDEASGKKSAPTEKAGEDSASGSGVTKKEPAAAPENGSGNKKSDETSTHSHSRRHHHTGSTETAGPESDALKKKPEETATGKPSAKIGSESASVSPTGKKPEATTASAIEKKEEAGNPSSHETATEPAAVPGKTAGGETGKTRSASEKEKETAETASHAESHSAKSPVTSTHHRHHHAEPPIVVTPSAVPLQDQVSPGEPPPTVLGGTAVPAGVAPTVETGLPVARPGAGTTATLPIDMGHRGPATSEAKFHFTDYPPPLPHRSTRTYPWKSNIITTVFWIGEGGSSVSSTTNVQSAWDMNWIHHNGGTDNPDEMSRMSGYSSLTHASTLNPFYIALPFNDLAYPEEAQRWMPSGWYHPPHHGEKPVSACQGRWVEIKTGSGRVCYAQWEDVGPLVSDHPQYVFGPERPETLTRAGLDVSPAVAKYLGFESTALTSWRFVDDDDVQPGMWLRYDEEAVLFQALKEQIHPNRTTPIQELDEPVPDGSGPDSSEKRSGAARG